MAEAIRQRPVWRDTDERLQRGPGVGPVWTSTLVASRSERGTVTNKQLAARFHPVIRAFYQRVQRAGTAKKVALTILTAMLKHRTPGWQVETPHA